MSYSVTIRYLGCKEITKLAKVPSTVSVAKLKKQLIKLNSANVDVDDVIMVCCGRRIFDSETLEDINTENSTNIEIYASGLRDITDPELFEEEENCSDEDDLTNTEENDFPRLDGFNPQKMEPVIIEKSMHAVSKPIMPNFKQIPQNDLLSLIQKIIVRLFITLLAIGFVLGVIYNQNQRREIETGYEIPIISAISPFSGVLTFVILLCVGAFTFYKEIPNVLNVD